MMLGSLLLPTSLLLLAFLLLLGCHKFVSVCTAHGHQFSTDIQLLKFPHFWKVAVTTAIWLILAPVFRAGIVASPQQRS
jgi:hypothetical protein